MEEKLNIVIVGASLSGLFAGLALVELGHHITILERHSLSDLQDQGAGLALNSTVVSQFLQHFSLSPEKYGLNATRFCVLDGAGREAFTAPWDGILTRWGHLHRGLMQRFNELAKSGDNGLIRFESAVQSVAEKGDKMVVECLDGAKHTSIEVDLVVSADGASSHIRQSIVPEAKRTYTGYVLFRGLVDEETLSSRTVETVFESGCFNWGPAHMFVLYAVPGYEDQIAQPRRLQNWGWFMNHSDEELQDLMSDVDGKTHSITLPPGKMQQKHVARIKEIAEKALPPQLVEVLEKTHEPFVQVVTDSRMPKNNFYSGKLVFVGDAVAGLRPHIASGIGQGVVHAALLRKYLEKKITLEQFGEKAMEISNLLGDASIKLGHMCQTETSDQTADSLDHSAKLQAYLTIVRPTWSQLTQEWDECAIR